jgi:hypothetical protein
MALSNIETKPTLELHSKWTATTITCPLRSKPQNPLWTTISSAILTLHSTQNKLLTHDMGNEIRFSKCERALLITGTPITYTLVMKMSTQHVLHFPKSYKSFSVWNTVLEFGFTIHRKKKVFTLSMVTIIPTTTSLLLGNGSIHLDDQIYVWFYYRLKKV